MASVYTVSQITAYIKHMFEQDFALNRVSVKGEVSNCKYHSSGHLYFTLKDVSGAIGCIMFAGLRKSTDVILRDGMQVIARGSIRVYERDGRYNLYVSELTADGIGELYRMFEERKRALEEMGMFAPEYKKPIPGYVRTVGIVTASTGAAVRDIMNISARRNPYVQLILYPAQVQGIGAAESIVRGIETLDRMGLDCLIVGRGGGSIEDLWAFNEESVARAIFQCDTPVISAVGHETDFTIADFAADLRAPTPSAAAELAVFDYGQFQSRLADTRARMEQALLRRLEETAGRVNQSMLRLQLLHPGSRLMKSREKLAGMSAQMTALMEQEIRRYRYLLEIRAQKLQSVSPLHRLSGGYALVTDGTDTPVEGIDSLPDSGIIRIHMRDGIAEARVTAVSSRPISAAGKEDEHDH